jgi:hypothetical protein
MPVQEVEEPEEPEEPEVKALSLTEMQKLSLGMLKK